MTMHRRKVLTSVFGGMVALLSGVAFGRKRTCPLDKDGTKQRRVVTTDSRRSDQYDPQYGENAVVNEVGRMLEAAAGEQGVTIVWEWDTATRSLRAISIQRNC